MCSLGEDSTTLYGTQKAKVSQSSNRLNPRLRKVPLPDARELLRHICDGDELLQRLDLLIRW